MVAPVPRQPDSGHYCVLPRTYGIYSSCCGSQVYDYRYNVCCDGVLAPNCGSTTSCCDQVAYNSELYICCYPSMIVKYRKFGIYTGCCGTSVYDFRNQSCCYDVVINSTQVNRKFIFCRNAFSQWSHCRSRRYVDFASVSFQ
jgi:hypothetical protein